MKDYHENPADLSRETKDYVRALNSLKEEVEAIDWYQQRMDATSDKHLKKILEHNRDEEMEHACMALEWLRRNMEGWDEQLRTYLFTEKEITKIEDDD
jgi:ferritin-like protein